VLHDPIYRDTFPRLFGIASSAPAIPLPDAGVYEAKDPPTGALLPSVGAGAEIRAKTPPGRAGYLVASMGNCTSCTRLDLTKLYRQARPRRIALLGFASGEPERARQLAVSLARDGVDVPIYFDRNAKLTAALNGYYSGRLYFFMPDWKLRWRERDWGIDNYLFSTGRFDRIMRNTSP
jgi:hypothetical protein